GDGTVSKVTPAGALSTFASGLNGPDGLAFDAAGNLYVANRVGNTVSKVTPGGAVSTFATLPTGSFPLGLAFDAAGTLYVANFGTNTVSKASPVGGGVTLDTAGTAGSAASPLHVVAWALRAHAQGGLTLATQVSSLAADGGAGGVSVTNTGDLTLAPAGPLTGAAARADVSVSTTGNPSAKDPRLSAA